METIKTWLPCSPGFYGTAFEADEDMKINNIQQERKGNNLPELPYDAIEWDYKEYEEAISRDACQVIENDLKDFVTKIRFEKLVSPREYNFVNDSIDIEVEISRDQKSKIMEFLNNNQDNFQHYLDGQYTSCDGFISHYSHDINDWLTPDSLDHQHKLGSILQFVWYQVKINDIYIEAPAMKDAAKEMGIARDEFQEAVMQDNYISAKNYDECCNYNYCSECGEFYIQQKGRSTAAVCSDCLEAGKCSGEYIVCSHCNTVIDNKWEKRQLEFTIKHKFLTYDKVVCSDCKILFGATIAGCSV